MIEQKKSGYPQRLENDFQQSLTLQKYSSLCSHINQTGQHSVSEKTLAEISISLQNLMEKLYGKNSARSNNFTKLPARLFYDYNDSGALSEILKQSLLFLKDLNVKDFNDSIFDDETNALKQFFATLERHLIKCGYLEKPTIFLAESVSHIQEELTKIIQFHGASVVASRDEASHIVEWDDEIDGSSADELAEDFIRPLEVRFDKDGGKIAYVHWWYHPNSYDEWIPGDDVEFFDPPDVFPTHNHNEKQWRVSARFIRDLEIFNEWGNEIDYEIDEEKPEEYDSKLTPASGTAGTNRGRKSRARSKRKLGEDSRKRPRESSSEKLSQLQSDNPISGSIPLTERMCADLPPPSGDLKKGSYVVVDVGPMEHGKPSAVVVKEEKTAPLPSRSVSGQPPPSRGHETRFEPTNTKDEPAEPEEKKLKLAASQIVRPSWFHPELVSHVEVRYLPEFFDRSSQQRNPQVYLAMRNFIISLYDQQPSAYLSATECRKKLCGDVCSVIAVHEFLDAFGVINTEVKPDLRPTLSPGFLTCTMFDETQREKLFDFSQAVADVEDSAPNGLGSPSTCTWTAEQDEKLINGVAQWAETVLPSSQQGSNSVRNDHSAQDEMKQVTDWESLASLFGADEQKSALDCLVRFAGISLPSPITALSGIQGVSRHDGNDPGNGSDESSLAVQTVPEEWIRKLGIDRSRVVIKAAIEAVSKLGHTDSNVSLASASLAVSSSAVLSHLNDDSNRIKSLSKSFAQEYILLRLQMLEEKMKLLSAVERDLNSERQRQELERRDIQIQRAILSFLQKDKDIRMKLLSAVERDLNSERQRQELERRDIQIQRAILSFLQKDKDIRVKS